MFTKKFQMHTKKFKYGKIFKRRKAERGTMHCKEQRKTKAKLKQIKTKAYQSKAKQNKAEQKRNKKKSKKIIKDFITNFPSINLVHNECD